jgi:hypothetical protein
LEGPEYGGLTMGLVLTLPVINATARVRPDDGEFMWPLDAGAMSMLRDKTFPFRPCQDG